MTNSSPKKKEAKGPQTRIRKALELAMRYGGGTEEHHNAWIIDQMVRHLTGCPTVRRMSPYEWADGKKHRISGLGESEEYLEFVRKASEGENDPDDPQGPNWSTGIAP